MAGKMMPGPNPLQKLIHPFLALQPVSAVLSKVLHHADSLLLRLTRGRHTFAELVGLPIVQLTMTGARTGKQRTLPLVSLPVDEKFVLIATNFGQKHNPAWYYNLVAHPECDVFFKGRSGKYIAHVIDGEAREKYWRLALSYYIGYKSYEKRAAPRRIPIMLLEPKK
jgi:deazaflavin-dependent oxidoreductase (nitroreductase family)